MIARPTRVTDQTATLIDYILTKLPDKVTQLGVVDLGLSDHDLIYCTRKTYLPKSHKHNEIFVRSVKKYSAKKVLENLFPSFLVFLDFLNFLLFSNYLTYTCVNDAYSDFIYRLCRSNKVHSSSQKDQSEDQLKTLVRRPSYVSNTKIG